MQTPVTEDLMNEHGLLNRILIIFDYYLTNKEKQKNSLSHIITCVNIIKEFIEDFHEIMEETYIFPRFPEDWQNIIQTLIQQHKDSRVITSELLNYAKNADIGNLELTLEKFIKLYRAHSAREDTIIFRKLRKFITPEEFIKISKIMDDEEDKKFGEHAYDKILKKIIIVEQELGISLTSW